MAKMAENLTRFHIFVSGLVQGVFYRQSTKEKAEELGLTGWVRNLPDGRVEIVAEGEEKKIKELIDWAKKGPISAEVRDLEADFEEYKNQFSEFKIRY